jgi:hypothetical protein
MEKYLQIRGRMFTPDDILWLTQTLYRHKEMCRESLARAFCQYAGWYKPNGGLKDMSCKAALLRLNKMGLLSLPAPQNKHNRSGRPKRTPLADPQPEIRIEASKICLQFELVNPKTSALWNELIDRYHYLGYSHLVGAQLRYFVRAGGQILALLGFCAAAWKVAARDVFIGWNPEKRQAHLHQVVNNNRFLILPWIKSQNLASRILSGAARILPHDWKARYQYQPLLLESFVEKERFAGTCYKAANWRYVGDTTGRGKWDRQNLHDKPIKSIYLYTLDSQFKKRLCE